MATMMLASNNKKPLKVKYSRGPKTRKELGIPDQQRQKPYTKQRAANAHYAVTCTLTTSKEKNNLQPPSVLIKQTDKDTEE
jgi:hypothetical protein